MYKSLYLFQKLKGKTVKTLPEDGMHLLCDVLRLSADVVLAELDLRIHALGRKSQSQDTHDGR